LCCICVGARAGVIADAGLELHHDRVQFLSHDYLDFRLIASDVCAASVDAVEQSGEGLGFARISDRYKTRCL
jgi:hypothetical protein